MAVQGNQELCCTALNSISTNTRHTVAFIKLQSSGWKTLHAHCNNSITMTGFPLIYVVNAFLIKVHEEEGQKEGRATKKTDIGGMR